MQSHPVPFAPRSPSVSPGKRLPQLRGVGVHGPPSPSELLLAHGNPYTQTDTNRVCAYYGFRYFAKTDFTARERPTTVVRWESHGPVTIGRRPARHIARTHAYAGHGRFAGVLVLLPTSRARTPPPQRPHPSFPQRRRAHGETHTRPPPSSTRAHALTSACATVIGGHRGCYEKPIICTCSVFDDRRNLFVSPPHSSSVRLRRVFFAKLFSFFFVFKLFLFL